MLTSIFPAGMSMYWVNIYRKASFTRLFPPLRNICHRFRKVHRRRVVLTNVSLTFNTLKVLGMSDEINRFFEVSTYTHAKDEHAQCARRPLSP